jgi:hypothetical protein
MYYVSCSGGTDIDSTKSTLGYVRQTCVFLHPVGSLGHVVDSSASVVQNIDALFFILG